MLRQENTSSPAFIVVDLFCGFGGTTKGYTMATVNGESVAYIAACVNHDKLAIESHWNNHPDVEHFNEDITQLYGQIVGGLLLPSLPFVRLKRVLDIYRAFYPEAKIILWASLECTDFSKAKGGMSRNPDSRTLARHLDRYIQYLEPDYIKIENVVEFMAWGPLVVKTRRDKDGYEYTPLRTLKIKKTFEEICGQYAQYLEPPRKKRNGQGKKKKPYAVEYRIVPHLVPLSTKNGEYWLKWREHLCSLGYRDEWRQLNSANYGAYTSRNRLFGIFARPHLPIVWPEATHAKKAGKNQRKKIPKAQSSPSLFDGVPGIQPLQPWKAVRDVLDFTDQGESIILRKKSLEPKSLERIYAGLVKFITRGDTSFLTKYFSGTYSGKNIPLDSPAGALTTIDHHALVQSDFLVKYNSMSQEGKYIPPSLDEPCPVVPAQDRLALARAEFITQRHNGDPNAKVASLDDPARTLTSTGGNLDLVQPVFLMHYYTSGGLVSSVDDPCPALTSMDGKAVIRPDHFMDMQYGKSQNQSIDLPAGTLMPNDKHRLITTDHFPLPTHCNNQPKSLDRPTPSFVANRRHHYLVNPSWWGHPGSVDQPSPVIIARGDKAPLYLIQVEEGAVAVAVYPDDSPIMVRIKQFMAAYGLVDIKMRMLRVKELLKIQGFPEHYKMVGTQSDRKKFIGNSVVPLIVKAWAEVLASALPKPQYRIASAA